MVKILLLFLIGYAFFRFLSLFFRFKFIKIDNPAGFGRKREIDITDRVRILEEESKKSGESRHLTDISKEQEK